MREFILGITAFELNIVKRIVYVDILKGFAIILVVIGHIIQFNFSNPFENPLFSFIYSFHMPFFFFLSGYIGEKTIKIVSFKDFIRFFNNKSISLLLPLFSWALMSKYLLNTGSMFSSSELYEVLLNELTNSNLWFLPMLFKIMMIYSLFYLISSFLKANFILDVGIFIIILIAMLILDSAFQELNIIKFILNFGFFMIGIFISKYSFLQKIIKKDFVYLISVLVFIFLSSYFDFIHLDIMRMKIIKILISLSAVVFYYNLVSRLDLPDSFNRFLSSIGKYTLVIYVTHFSLITLMPSDLLVKNDVNFLMSMIICVPLTIVLVSFCILIKKMTRTLPILDLLLFGNKITKKKMV